MLVNAIDDRFDEALRHAELPRELLDRIVRSLLLLELQSNLDLA